MFPDYKWADSIKDDFENALSIACMDVVDEILNNLEIVHTQPLSEIKGFIHSCMVNIFSQTADELSKSYEIAKRGRWLRADLKSALVSHMRRCRKIYPMCSFRVEIIRWSKSIDVVLEASDDDDWVSRFLVFGRVHPLCLDAIVTEVREFVDEQSPTA